MENEEGVILEDSPEEVTEVISEDEKTPVESEPKKTEEKVVPYDRFKKVNDELKKLKEQPIKEVNKALDVEDYIDISASLDGLDSREKEYLAKQHKLSGKPLKEIRNNEDFILWQSAYRAKVEKERRALEPTSEQLDAERPKSLGERLKNLPLSEQEKLLAEKGLYKSPKRRDDTVFIKK